jgi:acetylornithine deacetylase/succinyl-diaminopimelate desuccinylase-like protein
MTEVASLLRDLVARPSINPMGRKLRGPEYLEHQVTAYLEDFFRGLAVRYERQTIAPLRDNIVAFTDFPSPRRTLLLEVHQDTVPVDNMTIDPFAGRIEQGRLSGRGACDVKGGMAAMLAAFARLVRERPARSANVVLACTVDEEHTFLGVQHLANTIRADLGIAAEPTELNIVNAHKGVVRWYLDTFGRSCHSSSPEQGSNAIYAMGKLLVAIEQFAADLRASRRDPVLGPPTLSVGRIEGGSSVNTVPDRCRIEVDRRVIPGENARSAPKELAAYLRKQAGTEVRFDCSEPWLLAPALSSRGSEELVKQLGGAIDAVRGSHRVMPVPYGTDASTLAGAGIPMVVFGPGDIAQAHTCDEWISLDEVAAASEILYRFAYNL